MWNESYWPYSLHRWWSCSLSIFFISVVVSSDPHSTISSNTGCQCVSACRPSVYRATPWCHVKPSSCKSGNTVRLDNLSPSVNIPEEPFTSLSLPPSPPPDPRDVWGSIGTFIESFLNLAASSPGDLRLLQQTENSNCRCRQDVVGLWDFCDPSAARKVVESYSEFDLPPFPGVVPIEEVSTTAEPVPLLLLNDYSTSSSDLDEPQISRHEAESSEPSNDETSVSSVSSSPNSLLHNARSDRCHRSCKTCTRTSRGLDTECLSCHLKSDDPDGVKYHLIPLVGRANTKQQGRCSPITDDPDICHPTCKECRADCCMKSPRACVSCPEDIPFRGGPHRTVGQCIHFLSASFNSENSQPSLPVVHPAVNNHDWSGLISTDNSTKKIEASQAFPFSETLHPAVSSWLLRESQAVPRSQNNNELESRPSEDPTESRNSSLSVEDDHLANVPSADVVNVPRRKRRKKERALMDPFEKRRSDGQDLTKGESIESSRCNEIEIYLQRNNPGLSGSDLLTKQSIGRRYWTQLVFLHADNNIMEAGISDLNEMRTPINPQNFLYGMGGITSSPADYMHLVVLIDTKHQAPSRQDSSEQHWWDATPFISWLFGHTKSGTVKDQWNGGSRDNLQHESSQHSINRSKRVWTIPGEERHRRLESVSKSLGNIVICPNLSFTDGTTADQFNPDDGEAFELYRIPRWNEKDFDWLLLRRRGEVRCG